VWTALRSEARSPPGDRILAVGDPARPPEGGALPALPQSAEEAKDVAAFVPEDRRTVLTGEAASLPAVVDALGKPGVRRGRWRPGKASSAGRAP
jgi:hypothetical protein